MFRTLQNRVAFRAVLVALITVSVGIGSLLCTSRLIAISNRVEQSHEIIYQVKDLKYLLKDAESGQRGYLLTGGREEYLKSFDAFSSTYPAKVEHLSVLAARRSSREGRLFRDLRPLITQKSAEMNETIRLEKQGDPTSAIRVVKTDEGKRLMVEIEKVVDQTDQIEREALAKLADEAVFIRILKVVLDLLGAGFTVLILVALYLVVNREMVERRRAELELACARDGAEAASRAKGDFMANVSHEIRTPMNAILGMTELTLDTELSPQQHDNLQVVKSATHSLLAIINDLLDFSKMEAGKLSLAREDFGLRDHLGATLGLLGLKAVDKGLELSCRVAPQVPDRLSGDPARLRQILVNLVGNAIKFTNRGDVVVEVELEPASTSEVAFEPGSESTIELHFRVTDTGIGIAPEKREMVFAPFTQADGSTTRLYGGTGLGLAISTELVGLMGGRIWVESELGRGSTFHFTAKFTASEALPPPKPSLLESLKGLKVLVVDDNEVNRRILEELLRYWGLEPFLADGGRSAINELERSRNAGEIYPLVLLDALMPDIDGFTVARWIKADLDLKTTVLLMLTSSDRQGFADLAKSAGIAACLNKPIQQNKLLDAILETVTRSTKARSLPQPCPKFLSRQRPLKILMAEDNPHNQRVVVLMLAKSGHLVTVTVNGLEAIEALNHSSFDLILMDLQMPLMDGLQATAAIRAAEVGTSRRIPIIALTAHAMKEDKDRCLAAGMDGYVSKPIRQETILEAIRQCLEREPSIRRGKFESSSPSETIAPIDLVAALDRVEGDHEFLAKMAALFLEDLPNLMAELREAIATRKASSLIAPAHKLKNWSGNFVAEAMFAALARLEGLGRAGTIEEADAALPGLEREAERLSLALADLAPGLAKGDGASRVIDDDHRSRACIR